MMIRHESLASGVVASILFACVVACGSVSGRTPSVGKSAEEHEQQAKVHEATAAEHEDHYDPTVSVEVTKGTSSGQEDQDKYSLPDYNWGERRYNPTERHLKHAEGHERHANAHREAANTLRNFEEQQCASFPPETRAHCPLIGQIASVEEIPDGVRLFFADGVNTSAATDHIMCHLAFARTQAFQGMTSCPLYAQRVRMLDPPSGQTEARSVDLVVDSGGDVERLRTLAAEHVAPDS
jgi:hypothetical protein